MNRFRTIGTAALFALVIGLNGCGGGGGGSDPEPPAPKAEGAYAFNGSDNAGILLLVLENDELWGVYRLPEGTPGGTHGGFVHGMGSSETATYTVAEMRDYNFLDQIVETASLSANYVPGVSMDVTVTPTAPPGTPADPPFSFAATNAAVVGYDYNQPATAAAVAGQWTGFFGRSTEEGMVTISPQGNVTATTTGNCSFVGTVRPRTSGKNVYDVSLTFGAAPCGDPGATITGVAFIDFPSATTQELVVMLLNASGSVGRTFIGSR